MIFNRSRRYGSNNIAPIAQLIMPPMITINRQRTNPTTIIINNGTPTMIVAVPKSGSRSVRMNSTPINPICGVSNSTSRLYLICTDKYAAISMIDTSFANSAG